MSNIVKRARNYVKRKPHVAIGIPALLCFVTFIINFIAAISDGVIDAKELHQLLSTADGFEAVVLFVVMLVLKDKKK